MFGMAAIASAGSEINHRNQIKEIRKIVPNYEPLQIPSTFKPEEEKKDDYSIWVVIGAFFMGTFF